MKLCFFSAARYKGVVRKDIYCRWDEMRKSSRRLCLCIIERKLVCIKSKLVILLTLFLLIPIPSVKSSRIPGLRQYTYRKQKRYEFFIVLPPTIITSMRKNALEQSNPDGEEVIGKPNETLLRDNALSLPLP